MGWRRGQEQVVKKRMSCLMGCQECNSIIMKSDSGELDGWMAGRLLREAERLSALCTCLSILILLDGRKQVNAFLFQPQFELILEILTPQSTSVTPPFEMFD